MWWVLTYIAVASGHTSPTIEIKEYYGEPRCRQEEQILQRLAEDLTRKSSTTVRISTDCSKKLTD